MPPFNYGGRQPLHLILVFSLRKGIKLFFEKRERLLSQNFFPNAHRQNSIIPALRCMVISNNQCNLRPICTIPGKCRSFESVNFLHPYIKSSK